MGHTASMSPCVIAIVGHSGSGKTTLIERLLPVLLRTELRVATLKHSHHRVDMDVCGTDSWRHKQAGACSSMLVTPAGMQLVSDEVCDDPVQLARRYFFDSDLVLAEGFSGSTVSKIEVLRAACNPVARCLTGEGLIARVTDVECTEAQLPHFNIDDIDRIAQFILARQREQRHDR